MTVYGGNGGIAPFFLNLGNRWRLVVNFAPRPLYLRKGTMKQDAVWRPQSLWTQKRKISYQCRDLNSGSSSLVSKWTNLLRLPYECLNNIRNLIGCYCLDKISVFVPRLIYEDTNWTGFLTLKEKVRIVTTVIFMFIPCILIGVYYYTNKRNRR